MAGRRRHHPLTPAELPDRDLAATLQHISVAIPRKSTRMTQQPSLFDFPWQSPSRFDIHATWCPSAKTAPHDSLWGPVDGAEHFMLLSCFVSQSGWAAIKSLLRTAAKRTPKFRAQLIFSLFGMDQAGGAALLQKFKDFSERDEHRERIHVFLIEDSQAELFHPKGHASYARSIEECSRVVVGSANLTRGGMANHDEMMCVFENEPRIYSQFSRAFQALLQKGACPVRGENIRRLERWCLSRPTPPPRPSNTAPREGNPTGAPPPRSPELEPVDPAALDPTNASIEPALEFVAELLGQGVQVIRNDQYEDLSVSVALRRFVSAKIIPGMRTTTITDGVSLSRGSGSNGLNVHLTPDAMTSKLHNLNRELGRLLGHFSLDIAGLRWMPAEWSRRFIDLWDDSVSFYDVPQDHGTVEGHLTALRSLFTGNSAHSKTFRTKLKISPPSVWDISAAEKLLGKIEDTDLKNAESLKVRAFNAILRHCQEDLDRHLNSHFVSAQVRRSGMRPRHEPLEAPRLSLAIDVLADLAMAGINHRFKTTKEDGATGNAIASVLVKHIKPGVDPREVYNTAATWKRALLGEKTEHENRPDLLIAAWQCFLRWFSLAPETAQWHIHIPRWRALSERKRESNGPNAQKRQNRPRRPPQE